MILSLTEFLPIVHARMDNLFSFYLESRETPAASLHQAMHYAVTQGGKRIRPLLVYATGITLGASFENLDAPAVAIECIHAYSLIHDDLPAMDNADLRRGKPSCHKAFDEALAILAGDALQPLAFDILASHPSSLKPEQRLQMIQTLSHAAGLMGMVAGQALDITGMTTVDGLKKMHELKTGALIQASVLLGIIASNDQNPPIQAALTTFSECLGLLFQMQDDLLDTKSTTVTGKPQGLDHANQKITYVTLLGLEETKKTIATLFSQLLDAMKPLEKKASLLHDLAYAVLERKS